MRNGSFYELGGTMVFHTHQGTREAKGALRRMMKGKTMVAPNKDRYEISSMIHIRANQHELADSGGATQPQEAKDFILSLW